jgi:hypothetical protein
MNPYKAGGPVTGLSFYGRKELLDDILHTDRHIWIIGNRLVGKTSLLRCVESKANQGNQYVGIFVDFGGSYTIDQWKQYLQESIEEHKDVLFELGIDASRFHSLGFFQGLHTLTNEIYKQDRTLLLLCDEVEYWSRLAENDSRPVEQLRRYLDSRLLGKIKLVISATRQLRELANHEPRLGSPLLSRFAYKFIAQLKDKAADDLITQSLNPAGSVQISAQLRDKIRNKTGNHPFLLQRLCRHLYQEKGRSLRDMRPEDTVYDDELDDCFNVDFRNLDPIERRVLMALVRSGGHARIEKIKNLISVPNSLLLPHLKALKQLDYIRPSHYGVYVSNEFLWRWLKAKQDKDDYLHDDTAAISNGIGIPIEIAPSKDLLTWLRLQLTNRFDQEELASLSFDLGVPFEGLRGESKQAKARELVDYMRRRGQLETLITELQHLRPDIQLP